VLFSLPDVDDDAVAVADNVGSRLIADALGAVLPSSHGRYPSVRTIQPESSLAAPGLFGAHGVDPGESLERNRTVNGSRFPCPDAVHSEATNENDLRKMQSYRLEKLKEIGTASARFA
jgi:hypothetical protein